MYQFLCAMWRLLITSVNKHPFQRGLFMFWLFVYKAEIYVSKNMIFKYQYIDPISACEGKHVNEQNNKLNKNSKNHGTMVNNQGGFTT